MYIYELTCTYCTNHEFVLKPQFISLQSSSWPSCHPCVCLLLYWTRCPQQGQCLLWLSVSVLPVTISDFYPVKSESERCSVMSDPLRPHVLYSPWNSPVQNTGVLSCSLLQGIFPTQGSNPGLPHCRRILYHWSTREAPSTSNVLQSFWQAKKKKYHYVFWNVLEGLLVLFLGTTILMMKATWAQLIILQSLFWCAIYKLYEKCCGSTEMKMKNFIKAVINTREGNSTPLQYSCLENPMDGGAW